MSEEGNPEAVGERGEPEKSAALTAGMMMRSAREAAGLHVAALAVSMKIPVKKLEALEADRLDLLHDAVFVRALAASVCRALKIDPAPILSKLPLNTAPKLKSDERGINAPFHTHGDTIGISIPTLLSKPSALVVLALLLGGIAVAFFPDIKISDFSAESTPPSGKSSAGASQFQPQQPPTEVTEVATAPVPAFPSMPNSPGDVNEVISVPKNPPASSPSSATTAAKSTTTVAASPDANRTSVEPAVNSSGLVVFKAKGPSWVKVVDAKGVVQLSKTLVDGEVVGASGPTPLSVVIGRVDVTDVEVRGKAFSLTGVSKDNVARFEVK